MVRGRCRDRTDTHQSVARELKAVLQDIALHRMCEGERARMVGLSLPHLRKIFNKNDYA